MSAQKTATILAFPMARAFPAHLTLAAHNPNLDAERAALAAETAADIRMAIDDDVLPRLRQAKSFLDVMRHAITQIDPRHPLARAVLTDAETLAEVIASLQLIADPTMVQPPHTPPGAA
jgi:hypothetical protein